MKQLENLEKKAGAFKLQAESLKEAIYMVALVHDTERSHRILTYGKFNGIL